MVVGFKLSRPTSPHGAMAEFPRSSLIMLGFSVVLTKRADASGGLRFP